MSLEDSMIMSAEKSEEMRDYQKVLASWSVPSVSDCTSASALASFHTDTMHLRGRHCRHRVVVVVVFIVLLRSHFRSGTCIMAGVNVIR